MKAMVKQEPVSLINTRFEPSNIIGTKKFGSGEVMVWGCMSYFDIRKLIALSQKLNNILYVGVLAKNLYESDNIINFNSFFCNMIMLLVILQNIKSIFFENN